jgi:hypothetical protein
VRRQGSINIATYTRCGSVTNNKMSVRIGYRIYSLRRFTAATQVTITMSTIALVAFHFGDSLRALISSYSED